jgi:hypothetical protein
MDLIRITFAFYLAAPTLAFGEATLANIAWIL